MDYCFWCDYSTANCRVGVDPLNDNCGNFGSAWGLEAKCAKDPCETSVCSCRNNKCPVNVPEDWDGYPCGVSVPCMGSLNKCGCREYFGKWDASEKQCVECSFNHEKKGVYGDTNEIPSEALNCVGGNYKGISPICESGCGAAPACDEKNPGDPCEVGKDCQAGMGTCVGGQTCNSDCECGAITTHKLTVNTKLDIPSNPTVSNVQVTIDGETKSSGTSGVVDFTLEEGDHSITAESTKYSRNFGHFWDHDCDGLGPQVGHWYDTDENPYTFTMFSKDKEITVFYKMFTFITDSTGTGNKFEYNNGIISGRLLDEKNDALWAEGGKSLICGVIGRTYPINRDVKLEYFDGSWHEIGLATATAHPGDGSFSKDWGCVPGSTKIRASYTHTDWYYMDSDPVEIDISCPIDETPPTTSINPDGKLDANNDVPFTLTCTDNEGGTGCSVIYYKIIDETESCPTSTSTYTQVSGSTASGTVTCPSGEICEQYVCYRSEDGAENLEAVRKSGLFKIDKTVPPEMPDLVIDFVMMEDNKIKYRIRNAIEDSLADVSTTILKVDGVEYPLGEYYSEVGQLSGGDFSDLLFDYDWKAGCSYPSDTFEVCADYYGYVDESNEDNNCKTTDPWPCDVTCSVEIVDKICGYDYGQGEYLVGMKAIWSGEDSGYTFVAHGIIDGEKSSKKMTSPFEHNKYVGIEDRDVSVRAQVDIWEDSSFIATCDEVEDTVTCTGGPAPPECTGENIHDCDQYNSGLGFWEKEGECKADSCCEWVSRSYLEGGSYCDIKDCIDVGTECLSCEGCDFTGGEGEGECGNGIIEPGEQCDDGNTDPGDGCDENCRIEGEGECEGDNTHDCALSYQECTSDEHKNCCRWVDDYHQYCEPIPCEDPEMSRDYCESCGCSIPTEEVELNCENDEISVGDTNICFIVGCEYGIWLVFDDEENFLLKENIPPLDISFEGNKEGEITTIAVCRPPTPDYDRHVTQVVKGFSLICPDECYVDQDCKCEVTECLDGHLTLENEDGEPLEDDALVVIDDVSFEYTFKAKDEGEVKAEAICYDPSEYVGIVRERSINISTAPTTTTTSTTTTTAVEGEFEMSFDSCSESREECDIDIDTNTIDEDVVVLVWLFEEDDGIIYYTGEKEIDEEETGEIEIDLDDIESCPDDTDLIFLALAYTESDDDYENPIARIKEDTFTCG